MLTKRMLDSMTLNDNEEDLGDADDPQSGYQSSAMLTYSAKAKTKNMQ